MVVTPFLQKLRALCPEFALSLVVPEKSTSRINSSTTHLPTPLFPSLPLRQQSPQIYTMNSPSTAAVHMSGTMTMKVLFNGFAGLLAEQNQVQKSTNFTCLGRPWQIRIYPGGNSTAEEGMISVFLHNMSGESIIIEYTLIIKTCKLVKRCNFAPNQYFWHVVAKEKFEPHKSRGYHNFGMRSKILELLEDGALVK
jgi:hypothetical protein